MSSDFTGLNKKVKIDDAFVMAAYAMFKYIGSDDINENVISPSTIYNAYRNAGLCSATWSDAGRAFTYYSNVFTPSKFDDVYEMEKTAFGIGDVSPNAGFFNDFSTPYSRPHLDELEDVRVISLSGEDMPDATSAIIPNTSENKGTKLFGLITYTDDKHYGLIEEPPSGAGDVIPYNMLLEQTDNWGSDPREVPSSTYWECDHENVFTRECDGTYIQSNTTVDIIDIHSPSGNLISLTSRKYIYYRLESEDCK